MATETLLAEFLREIHDVSGVRKQTTESPLQQSKYSEKSESRPSDNASEKILDIPIEDAERAAFIIDQDERSSYDPDHLRDDFTSDIDFRDAGGQ